MAGRTVSLMDTTRSRRSTNSRVRLSARPSRVLQEVVCEVLSQFFSFFLRVFA